MPENHENALNLVLPLSIFSPSISSDHSEFPKQYQRSGILQKYLKWIIPAKVFYLYKIRMYITQKNCYGMSWIALYIKS